MSKQELLKWLESLPDNARFHPFETLVEPSNNAEICVTKTVRCGDEIYTTTYPVPAVTINLILKLSYTVPTRGNPTQEELYLLTP